MSVRINEDASVVAAVKDALKKTGGYCPCVVFPTESDRCMCEDFRKKVADPDFTGWCHCNLYYKEKDK